jgi:rRNA-processing protein FCF1
MEVLMSTVNFSVPEEVKQAFNETFHGQNKSAIVAELMLEAVERARLRQRGHESIARILKRREHSPIVTEAEIQSAREDGRP